MSAILTAPTIKSSIKISLVPVTKFAGNCRKGHLSEEIFNGKLYILYRVSLKSINCGENEQTKTQTCRWNYNYYQCQRAKFY